MQRERNIARNQQVWGDRMQAIRDACDAGVVHYVQGHETEVDPPSVTSLPCLVRISFL